MAQAVVAGHLPVIQWLVLNDCESDEARIEAAHARAPPGLESAVAAWTEENF